MRKLLWAAGLLGVVALVLLGPLATHHLLPLSWTGQPRRLAAVIEAKPDDHIADIGAGTGAMARELARVVGPNGRVYATEISPELRERIRSTAAAQGLSQISVVEAHARATNLPDACCSAIYLRHVLHHIDDWPAYAEDLARTVRPGGVIAIIDFAPGAMFHLSGDHGADPEQVIRAFTAAGLSVDRRVDDWGGRTYMVAFRKPQS